jgi:hypothetical protein
MSVPVQVPQLDPQFGSGPQVRPRQSGTHSHTPMEVQISVAGSHVPQEV